MNTTQKEFPLAQPNFLSTVRNQESGFAFGQPQRVGEKSLAVVLPILRQTDDLRNYITFSETEKVNVTDTGQIDEFQFQNQTDDNVFIRSGTIFTGKTQARALQRSAVLLPKEKTILKVRCVHASHGISPGAAVKYDGITPLDLDKGNYDVGYVAKDQQAYWSNVHKSTANMYSIGAAHGMVSHVAPDAAEITFGHSNLRARGLSAGSDNLSDHFKNFAKNFDSLLAKVKRVADQVGLALITDAGVETVELFEHADSWKALHDAAVKRLGPDLAKIDANALFEPKLDKARVLVDQVLTLPYKFNLLATNQPQHDDPHVEVFGMTAGNFVGEMVLIDGKVIHLVLPKTDS